MSAALVSEVALLLLFQVVGDARPALGVALLLAAFLPYVAAYRLMVRSGAVPLLPVAALIVVLYLPLLFQGPTLDDDLWRYRWDGKVVSAGINPYHYPPQESALEHLRDPEWEQVSFKQVRTVYPPVAQLLFALCYRTGEGSLWPFRVAAVAGHLGCIALLALLLSGAGLPARRSLLYAWNPMIAKEIGDSAHMDPWMVLMVLAALLAYQRGKRVWLAPALAGAIGFKWVPLLTLPLWRGAGLRTIAAILAIVVVICLPWAGAGMHLFDGLRTYADYWVFNPGIYWGLRGIFDPVTNIAAAKTISKAICLLAWLAIYLRVAIRQRPGFEELAAALFAVIGALLLLSPTLDPWYLTWVLPLACLSQGRLPTLAWWWLSAASCLSYLYYVDQTDVPWGRWLEYLAFAALWLWEWRRIRQRSDRELGTTDEHRSLVLHRRGR